MLGKKVNNKKISRLYNKHEGADVKKRVKKQKVNFFLKKKRRKGK